MSEVMTLAALAGVALVAGFVDSIAGGGGLLCLPALLLSGLDPVAAPRARARQPRRVHAGGERSPCLGTRSARS